MKSFKAWLSVVSLLGICFGCGPLPEPPKIIPISDALALRPRTPQQIKTPEEAMAVVMTVTSQDLGLPLVQPLYLHLHKDSAAFGAYAGRDGRRLPQDVVQFAAAVAEENRFHINLEKTRNQPWNSLLWTLAHEYAHNIEYTLSVQRGPQWIREGFADWVAARVMHILGWQDYDLSLHRARAEVSRLQASLPSLSNLEESSKWSAWANQPQGSVLTYRLSFLAVSRLIDAKGLPAMTGYFRSKNFQASFGMSQSEFENTFRSSLSESKPPASVDTKAERAEWKPGYRWTYAVKAPGTSGKLSKEVVGDDILEGIPVYKVKVGQNESVYTRDVLGFIGTIAKDKWVTKRSPPFQSLAWPMEVGKEWRSSFTLETVASGATAKPDYLVTVAGLEQIKVPAGSFLTFKINVFGFQSGSLVTEYWYSPEVKWFVRQRDYLASGVRQEELVSFNAD